MKKAIYYIFLVLLLAVMGTAGVMLYHEIRIGQKEQAVFDTIVEEIYEETSDNAAPTPPPSKIKQLKERYPDITGWIKIEGTVIDYPVVHTPGHTEKYLRMDLDGNYARSGVPFLDGRVHLDSPHLLIYGHNMLNGTMFSDLTKYENRDFAKENDEIILSLAEEERRYRIFAVIETDGSDNWYRALTFATDEQYQKQVEGLSNRSMYDGQLPEAKAQLLTLSTCSGARQQKRLLVIAARI